MDDSGSGRQEVLRSLMPASLWSVVPLHGDWVTSPATVGTELPVLWSPDGLDWEERASLPVSAKT